MQIPRHNCLFVLIITSCLGFRCSISLTDFYIHRINCLVFLVDWSIVDNVTRVSKKRTGRKLWRLFYCDEKRIKQNLLTKQFRDLFASWARKACFRVAFKGTRSTKTVFGILYCAKENLACHEHRYVHKILTF